MSSPYFDALYTQAIANECTAANIVSNMVFLHDESGARNQWCMQDVPELFRLARILARQQQEFHQNIKRAIKNKKDLQNFNSLDQPDIINEQILFILIERIFEYCAFFQEKEKTTAT